MDVTRRSLIRAFAAGGSAALFARCGFAWDESALPASFAPSTEDDWALVRRRFVLPEDLAYLNAANLCPSPAPVLEAMYASTRDIDADPSYQNRARFRDSKERTRKLLADHLRVSADEVVITRNTSEGNNMVSSGLDLGPGDEVVLFADNHPSNNRAWKAKAERFGFAVSEVPAIRPHPGPEAYVEAFRRTLGTREAGTRPTGTRVLAFTHVTNTTGDLLPAKELCRLAREHGALSLVDGAQAFGVLDLDLADMAPDFYTGSGHKWPCGAKETGLLYVRAGVLPRLHPSIVSLYGGASGAAAELEALGQRDDGAILALGEAIAFLGGIGPARIERRARELTQALMAGLARIDGVELITDPDPARSAAVVVFRPAGLDSRRLHAALYENDRVVASTNAFGIRLSPHLYCSHAEVERTLSAIARYVKSGV